MNSHELLRDVFQNASPKQVASELGLSVSMVYKWAEPPASDSGSGASNPLDRLVQLQKSTGDIRITQWVCHQSGGYFVRNPSGSGLAPGSLLLTTNQVIQEFADLIGAITQAVTDNQISPAESKDIRARWEELKSVTEEFVVNCECGKFSTIAQATFVSKKANASSNV